MLEQKYWMAENGEVRCLDDRCPQECDMECPIYLQTLAFPYLQNGHVKEAAKYLEKAVAIEPTFAEAWNNLAACYGQMAEHQRAFDCYLKSFELREKPKPLFGMAVAMKNMGNYANAMQYAKMYERRYGKDNLIGPVLAEIAERQETKSKSTFIKQSGNGEYGLWEMDGRFLFCSSDKVKPEVFTTPANSPITTSYRKLADAILEDLDTHGPKNEDLRSVAKWHYDLVKDYIRLKDTEFADVVKEECLRVPDWTEAVNKNDAWTSFFKYTLVDSEAINAWIDKCSHMQLNAILHVYRALKSIRIALSVARIMECMDEDEREKLDVVTNWVVDNSEYPYLFVSRIISNFKLYYGIHLEENGDMFDDSLDYEEDQFFIGQKVSQEILIGRNYYLYEEGLKIKDQPARYEPDDIALYCSDDEYEEEEESEPEYDALEMIISERCWIRRISALEEGKETYLLIAITVDDDFATQGHTDSELTSIKGKCIVILRNIKTDETITVCLDSEGELNDTTNCSLGCIHINSEQWEYTKLMGKKINHCVSLHQDEYMIISIRSRTEYIIQFIFKKIQENPDEFHGVVKCISGSDSTELVEQLKQITDRKDYVMSLIDSYDFKNNDLGLPIDAFISGDYSRYIDALRMLLFAKDLIFHAGQPVIDNFGSRKFVPALSTLVLLSMMDWLKYLKPLVNDIVVPQSYATFFQENYIDASNLQNVSPGTMTFQDNQVMLIEHDKKIPDIWEGIIEFCEDCTYRPISTEERIGLSLGDNISGEQLMAEFNLHVSHIDALILSRKENAIYICDDLFFRKLASSMQIENINFVSMMLHYDSVNRYTVFNKLSETNYFLVPFLTQSDDEAKQRLKNHMDGKRKAKYYGQYLTNLLRMVRSLPYENVEDDNEL